LYLFGNLELDGIIIVLKFTKWVLTTDRFTYTIGVFSRKTENLELYRIKDFTLRTPFLLWIFGYGLVDLVSSDKTDPNMPCIGAIKSPQTFTKWYANTQSVNESAMEYENSTSLD